MKPVSFGAINHWVAFMSTDNFHFIMITEPMYHVVNLYCLLVAFEQ